MNSCACDFCGECVQNCDRCPAGCQFVSIYNLNKMRIKYRAFRVKWEKGDL